ncbi:MAG: tRNA uridine-5-carboxymethylaminomethyl(34) synthesis GTPase MnmE [Lachnospiraceae bacterium]|nr:tRNA uridine-5-carboxymethylaminomethyl(34) synthesis GTPase MnmE [Lachnospiraceae bacterium]
MINQTIAAVATAMTNSGIGIVRISGPESFDIIDKIYRKSKLNSNKKKLSSEQSHTIHYGYIVDEEETIDEVLILLMRGPRSFTGEDTVEIDCHGGVFVVNKILETVVKYGARPADPGEFTKRAFLNGRIDLSQAEAVIDVINAKNEYALKSSVNQLKGSVQEKISDIRKKIIYHTAFIETALDDPEHINMDGYGEQLKITVDKLQNEIQELLMSSDNGRIIKEGIQTVIVGKPNAGKSSLLNALVGKERAIVTDIEGTTRDILEEHINLNGISLNVIDTAGIRDTEDKIEKIGVDKAKDYAKDADLIIYVVDASRKFDENDDAIFQMIKEKQTVILLNKSDLDTVITKQMIVELLHDSNHSELKNIQMIEISAKKEQGIRELEETLKQMFFKGNISFNDEIFITNMRQKKALQDAYESLQKVNASIENNMPEDFYTIDLLDAYESLGNITGETIGEDLVNEIFSKFCMGK